MKRLLVSTTIAVGAIFPALATDISDTTPCNAMVMIMESKDPAQIREIVRYVWNVMDKMDIDHVQRGEPGIMGQLSDSGKLNLVAAASVECRDHPNMTVYNSASLVYRGTRDMEIGLGAAK